MEQSKNQLMKEVGDLKEQSEKLRKKRAEWQAKSENAEKEIESLNQERGAALLDGRDTTILSDKLSRARAELEGALLALSEADGRVVLLDSEIREKQTQVKMSDFYKTAFEAEAGTIRFIAQVESAIAELKVVEATYQGLHNIAPVETGGDQVVIMFKTFDALREMFIPRGDAGIAVKLSKLEEAYRPYIAKAREKK